MMTSVYHTLQLLYCCCEGTNLEHFNHYRSASCLSITIHPINTLVYTTVVWWSVCKKIHGLSDDNDQYDCFM